MINHGKSSINGPWFPDVSSIPLRSDTWGRSARRAVMTLACWPGRWAWRPRSIPRAVIWFWSPTMWPSKQAPSVSRRTGVHESCIGFMAGLHVLLVSVGRPGNHYSSTDLCIAEIVVVLHWLEQWSFGFTHSFIGISPAGENFTGFTRISSSKRPRSSPASAACPASTSPATAELVWAWWKSWSPSSRCGWRNQLQPDLSWGYPKKIIQSWMTIDLV